MSSVSSEAVSGHERYLTVRKVTLTGSAVDFTLSVLQLVVGWMAQSQALIADGIHTLSDLASDVLLILAAKQAHREADAAHPYGHARIETLATMGFSIGLVLVAIGITYDAVDRLFHPERLMQPGFPALIVAIVCVLSKEAIYRYIMHHARRLRSSLLQASAWHSRSDAFSSMAVIAGIMGAMAGVADADAIAAIVVAVMIGRVGWRIGLRSMRELVDTGLSPDEVEDIKKAIVSVSGVETLHMLRTRQMGGKTLIDVHIILEDPRMSVSEGHQISETVRARLIKHGDDIVDVTVHIDPEDDEDVVPNRHLPLRHELLSRLQPLWAGVDGADMIENVTLHYLDAKVNVDLHLPLALAGDPEGASARTDAFRHALHPIEWIGDIRLFYR